MRPDRDSGAIFCYLPIYFRKSVCRVLTVQKQCVYLGHDNNTTHHTERQNNEKSNLDRDEERQRNHPGENKEDGRHDRNGNRRVRQQVHSGGLTDDVQTGGKDKRPMDGPRLAVRGNDATGSRPAECQNWRDAMGTMR